MEVKGVIAPLDPAQPKAFTTSRQPEGFAPPHEIADHLDMLMSHTM